MELKLPELGENIERVDVSAVLVSEGDEVTEDQPVIEVETEKASLEVPSSCAGRVSKLLVSKGDQVSVGQVILVVEPGGSGAEARPTPEPAPEPAPEKSEEEEPRREEAAPDPIEQLDRDVRAVEVPRSNAPPDPGRTVPAAPSVRALARELGVDIFDVKGSGPGGRISHDDVKAHTKRILRGSAPGPADAPALPDFAQWGEVEREPLSKIRETTASRMARAWTTVPHVTQFDRSDISDLDRMRRRFNRTRPGDPKLTMTALVIKFVARNLARHPKFNASLDVAGGAVVFKKYVHIGVAVDTDRGLLVPVIRDADRKGVLAIAEELGDLAGRARDKKLKPEEMQGAGFTISNLGGLGTTYFSPIVNWPEVAILGLGRASTEAVWDGERFEPRLVLPLSVSYDHRLIDGADAARFLRDLAVNLEQPMLMMLDGDTE